MPDLLSQPTRHEGGPWEAATILSCASPLEQLPQLEAADEIFPLIVVHDRQAGGYWITSPGMTSLHVKATSGIGELVAQPLGAGGLGDTLDELGDWTGLSGERLASLFGASRRSLYNWRRGASMGADFSRRIVSLHSVLEPLVRTAGVSRIQGWLQGEPRRLALLAGERWDEFEAEAGRELGRRTLRRVDVNADTGPPTAYEDAVAAAWHSAFLGQSQMVAQARRADWQPRELTGADPDPEDT